MFPDEINFKGRIYVPKPDAPPPVQLYMHKEDRAVLGGVRSCAPCPAVFVLKDDPHVRMDRQWQYYLRAANYSMTLENVFLLLDDHLAFANNTGFVNLDNPGRIDYFFGRTNYSQYPTLDKVRTCSRSVLAGTEAYSLRQALTNAIQFTANAVKNRNMRFSVFQRGFARYLTAETNVLKVKVFDSRQPPPLKPGKSYPTSISQVNIDDYLYSPQHNPEMFLVANVVRPDGTVYQFPRGATYPWFLDGRTPASFMPHIANLGYGDVLYPLWKLEKLPLGSARPSPYRY
jgi:hypothetical protein